MLFISTLIITVMAWLLLGFVPRRHPALDFVYW